MAPKTFKELLRAASSISMHRGLRRARRALDPFASFSYAQEGEDLILRRLLEGESLGFYVDVGALHPKRFSNTCIFYDRGWRGINIDPNPDAVALFRRVRPRDITVQVGVSDEPGSLVYYQFNEPALNTLDGTLAQERLKLAHYRLMATSTVEVKTLAAILDEFMPPAVRITFLSVDAEGFDTKVLRSNDWMRFRPRYVLAEALGSSLTTLLANSQCTLLSGLGYEPVAKTLNTVIYRDLQDAR